MNIKKEVDKRHLDTHQLLSILKEEDEKGGNRENIYILCKGNTLCASIGIETLGGVITLLLEKGLTVPCEVEHIFSTNSDNQSAISIHILQGEKPVVTDSGIKSLGKFNLIGFMPAPRGVPQVKATFKVGSDGHFLIDAVDLAAGKQITVLKEM